MAEYFTKTQQSYFRLLNRVEWKIRHDQIVRRDGCRCMECGEADIKQLQVHHKYYVEGYDPWEYPDDTLITLCKKCHNRIHSELISNNETVPLYRFDLVTHKLLRLYKGPCKRCCGKGYINRFRHNRAGICFECWGIGIGRSVVKIEESFDLIDFYRYKIHNLDAFLFCADNINNAIVLYDDEKDSYYVKYGIEEDNGLLHNAPFSTVSPIVAPKILSNNEYKVYMQLNGRPVFVLAKDIPSSETRVNSLEVLKIVENEIYLLSGE